MIHLQMSNALKFAFIMTALIIFCLMLSLNIPHSYQNPSFFPLEGTVSISSLNFPHHTIMHGDVVLQKFF